MLLQSQTHIRAIFAKAQADLNARKFNAAVQGFKQVLAVDPNVAEAHFQIARVMIAGDRSAGALKYLRRAAELNPEKLAYWQAWAEAAALAADEEQEKEFLMRLSKAPIDVPAKLVLQDRFGVLRRSSRPKTGGLSSKNMGALVAAMTSKRFSDAEKMASAALKKYPQSAIAANILASAQSALGKTALARRSYQLAIRLDPKYAEAYNHLGRLLLDQNNPDEASEVLKKSVILAPGLLPALVDLADALVRINRHRAALPLLARAEKIDPKSVPVQVAIANANIRAHDAEKANAAFEKAIDLSATPLPANARTAYAMTKSRLGDDQAAYAVLAEVLSETPDFAPALGGMGELLQTLGRFDEAMASFEKSMELAPNRGDVYRMYVAGKKISSDDPILPRMIEIYDTEKLEDTDRMHLAFAIAKSQEDIKDYTRSFEYLDAANALVRKSNPHSMNARKREILRYKEAYGDFDYRGAKTPGATEYAPIFVTGMPRSGTTLVEQIISSHSTVTGAGEIASAAKAIQSLLAHKNEVRKLSNVPLTEFSELGRAIEAHLRTRFPDTPHITDKAILTYMHIGPIKLAMPKARFVLVRRDPRDNLLSIYKNKFPDGTHLYAYDQLDLVQYYSTFVEMVNFWRELVPDWFYEVQYEELVANPEEETRKLIAACGLEWEDSCLDFHENKRKVQTLSVFQARQPISKGSVKSWQRYEKELKPMLDALREASHVTD